MSKVFLLLTVFIVLSCNNSEITEVKDQNEPSQNLENEAASSSTSTTLDNFIINSPNTSADAGFGSKLLELPNGNIIIKGGDYISNFQHHGEVYLFNPVTKAMIASFQGSNQQDQLGKHIHILSNNNFVIASPNINNDRGAVMLINGVTGSQIGSTFSGNYTGHLLGDKIKVLSNGNFAIITMSDIGNSTDTFGVVKIINGTTGQIIKTFTGAQDGDYLGWIFQELDNGNIVIGSPNYTVDLKIRAGMIMLINGNTLEKIGSEICGDSAYDNLGSSTIMSVGNGNFVVTSRSYNGSLGAIMLFNETTGTQIGTTITGALIGDQIGNGPIVKLDNGNFVVSSTSENVDGKVFAGSVRLMNSATGSVIGTKISGTYTFSQFGQKIIPLKNNNYVISTPIESNNGLSAAGSIVLVDGLTGTQIGNKIFGDNVSDYIGNTGILALDNGNFVVTSASDNVAGIEDAGSIMLINGTTGAQIGASIYGDDDYDNYGLRSAALPNNFVIISNPNNDDQGVQNAGSVILLNGNNGDIVEEKTTGNFTSDQFGEGLTVLSNGNYVITSRYYTNGSNIAAGIAMLFDGTTHQQIGDSLIGGHYDQFGTNILALQNGNYLMSSQFYDHEGTQNVGVVHYRLGE